MNFCEIRRSVCLNLQ